MTPRGKRAGADQGFTLLEVVFTVLIIGILLGIAVATYVATTNAANSAACLSNQDTLNKAISIAASAGTPPDTLDDLEPYVTNYDTIVQCPKDGTPLVFDPTANLVTCPNHP